MSMSCHTSSMEHSRVVMALSLVLEKCHSILKKFSISLAIPLQTERTQNAFVRLFNRLTFFISVFYEGS